MKRKRSLVLFLLLVLAGGIFWIGCSTYQLTQRRDALREIRTAQYDNQQAFNLLVEEVRKSNPDPNVTAELAIQIIKNAKVLSPEDAELWQEISKNSIELSQDFIKDNAGWIATACGGGWVGFVVSFVSWYLGRKKQ